MSTYYKATETTGLDFYSGTVDYAAALASGKRIRLRTPAEKSYTCCTAGVLHASDAAAETLVGGSWPCRLFAVEGRPVASVGHKFGFRSLRVVEELDARLALGPNGAAVAALVERCRTLTLGEMGSLAAAWGAARYAARDAAWGAARYAARDAARNAARNAVRGAAREAARDAAQAVVVRDLIEPDHYQALTHPWATVIGPAHPDDAEALAPSFYPDRLPADVWEGILQRLNDDETDPL